MKTNYKNYIILIYLIISFISLSLAPFYLGLHTRTPLADPIYILINVIGSLLIVVTIEFIIIYGFVRKIDLDIKDLFISVLLINIITFFPTQVITHLLLAFYIQFVPVYMITVFVIILSTEWLLYRLVFQKLFKKKSLNREFSDKQIFLMSTVANLSTGLIIYLYSSIILLSGF